MATEPIATRSYDVYALKLLRRHDPTALGRRDITKLETLSRVSQAARDNFATKGYDLTTMHDIASAAGIAVATLNLYVASKQDLIVLLFIELLAEPIECDLAPAGPEIGPWAAPPALTQELIAMVAPIYRACASDIGLSRILLRENMFSDATDHVHEARRLRGVLVRRMGDLLRQRQTHGAFDRTLDIEFAARAVFLLLFAAIRTWIAGAQPLAETGLADLRRMLTLLVDGMATEKRGKAEVDQVDKI